MVLSTADDTRGAGIDAIRTWRAALEDVAADLASMAMLARLPRAPLLQLIAARSSSDPDGVARTDNRLFSVHHAVLLVLVLCPGWLPTRW